MARVGYKYKSHAKELIYNILGFTEEDENFERSLNYIMSNLLYHHCLDVNSHSVKNSIQGIAFKMGIHGFQKKADKLLNLTEKFISSPEFSEDVDIKWSILSLLVELAHQPARDPLSASLSKSQGENSENLNLLNISTEEDWMRELMERSLHIPDKDETLSEWSDDEMKCSLNNSLEMGDGLKISYSNASQNFALAKERETMAKNTYLAKSWLSNTVQPNYWEDNVLKIDREQRVSGVLSEYSVMRESLWILLSPANGYIFTLDVNKQIKAKSIATSSLNREDLGKMLQTICHSANQLKTLDDWVEVSQTRIKDEANLSGTLLAYLEGLVNWRISFNNQITKLENIIFEQKTHQSLLWMVSQLEPSVRNLSVVYQIHSDVFDKVSSESIDRRSLRLISVLVSSIDSYMCSSNRKCIYSLFRYAFRHHIQLLQSILWNKNVSELSLKHFGIYLEKTQNKGNKEFTIDNSFINELKGLNFIVAIQQYLVKICKHTEIMGHLHVHFEKDCINLEELVNKSLEKTFIKENSELSLIKTHKEENNKHSKPNAVSTDVPNTEVSTTDVPNTEVSSVIPNTEVSTMNPNFYGEYSDPFIEKAFQIDRKEICTEPNSFDQKSQLERFVNLENLLTNILVPVARQRYNQLGTGLMKFLVTQNDLKLQLYVFKSVMLMEAGDVMLEFYSYLFSKMDCKEDINEVFLTQHIQSCISLKYPNLCENFSISFINSTQHSEKSLKYYNDILSSISLQFDNAWPISLVITDNIVKKYNRLFVFCLMLKRATFTMERLHFKEIGSFNTIYMDQDTTYDEESSSEDLSSVKNEEQVAENHIPFPHRLHRLQLLRQWLLYLTSNLHDHFYTSVLIPFSHQVDKLLVEGKLHEAFVQEHEILLDRTIRQCLLLEDSISPVQNALLKVFSTVEALKELWRGSPDKVTNEKLVDLEEKYSLCHRFMANFFTTLSEMQIFPHVDELAQSLKNSIPICC